MNKGDLIQCIKTGNIYLVCAKSVLSGREWFFLDPVNDGIRLWTKSKQYQKIGK